MAEETTIIDFKLDYGNSKTLVKELTDAVIANSAALKDNKAQQKELSKSEDEHSEAIKKLKTEEIQLKDKGSELNRERKKAVDITKIQANSLEGLRKQTKAMFAEREKLNTATKQGSARFKELTEKIKANNDQIKKADQDAGSYTSSIGSYKEAIAGLSPQFASVTGRINQMITSLKVAKAGTQASSGALKVFKIALASTGIGLLLVALGSLVTMFRQSEEGQDKLNKIMTIASSVFNNIKDVIAEVGEAIYSFLVNPMETVRDLWAGLQDFLEHPIESMEKGFDNIAEAAKNFGNEIANDVEKAGDLADQQAQYRRDERKWNLERVEGETKIAELRLKAQQDDQYSAEQRVKFQREAIAIQNELLDKQEEMERRKLDLINIEASLAKNTIEFNDEINAQEVKLAEQRATRLSVQRSLERKLQTLLKESATERSRIAKEDAKIAEDKLELDKQILDDTEESEIEFQEAQLEREIEQQAELLTIRAEAREKDLEDEQEHLEQMKALREQYLDYSQQALNIFADLNTASLNNEENRIVKSYDKRLKALKKQLASGQITEEQYNEKSQELEKNKQIQIYNIEKKRFENAQTFALTEIAINTAQAVMKVWSELGIGAIVGQLLPIAAGLAQAALVKSQAPPPPPAFAQGGNVRATVLGGNYHTSGGVKFSGSDGTRFEAERGEGVFITKRQATAEALSAINQKYGGRSFFNAPGRYFASGGSVRGLQDAEQTRQVVRDVLSNAKIVVQVEDIQNGLNDRSNIINAGIIE